MESSPPAATKWEDLDSDEIASVVSEDLYENRPNRWTGAKSTWRDLTGEERMLWRSMQQVVDQDLAVHLYDAFALKRQGLDPKTAEGLTVKLDDGQDAIWAPPKAWTAWPLQEKQVPREGLFRETRAKDEDEAFTLRRKEDKLPSTELQEELGATILRLAKQRFRRRQQRRQQRTGLCAVQPSIEVPSSPVPVALKAEESEDDFLLPSSPPGMVKSEFDGDDGDSPGSPNEDDNDDDDNGDDNDNDSTSSSPSDAANTPTQDYEPDISTDDQLSQRLLRPSVRHILTQLDRTLTVLHNARSAGLSYLSDSDSSTEDDSGAATPRKRGRPRRRNPQTGDVPLPAATPSRRRRGRPRKLHVPLEGESLEEMQLRIARQSHRRLPWTEKDKDAAFEAWLQQGQQQQRQAHPRDPASPPPQQGNTHRKLRRWGLRDWSDVLGAASLAGFPPNVIARSAQRCANLFQQGMTIRTLHEQPSSRPGFSTTEYRPEDSSVPRASLSPSASTDADSESDSNLDEALLSQKRIASRTASLARSRSAHSPHSRSRSRSRSSAGLSFCPMQTCPRAADGFARRANLQRHMHLVHPGCADHEEQDESEDEVVGAVHVDGFLKTIHPGRGWRGEDVLARKRKRFYGRGDRC